MLDWRESSWNSELSLHAVPGMNLPCHSAISPQPWFILKYLLLLPYTINVANKLCRVDCIIPQATLTRNLLSWSNHVQKMTHFNFLSFAHFSSNWEAGREKKGKEEKKKESENNFSSHFPNPYDSSHGPCRSWEPRTSSGSPTWTVGTETFENIRCTSQRSWIQSAGAKTWTRIPLLGTVLPSNALSCCVTNASSASTS